MAHGEECQLHKHQPLSSEHEHPYRKPDVATHPPVISVGKLTGEFLKSSS